MEGRREGGFDGRREAMVGGKGWEENGMFVTPRTLPFSFFATIPEQNLASVSPMVEYLLVCSIPYA